MLSMMILAMILWCAIAANAGSDIEKKLKESFPDIAFDSVKESPVKGRGEGGLHPNKCYVTHRDRSQCLNVAGI